MSDIHAWVDRLLAGDRRALSRILSIVELQNNDSFMALEKLWKHTGSSHRIGITGPAGAGKSTLIDQLIRRARKEGKTVGVVAVDPSSPFTGGAVLGDSVRMQRHSEDDGVFIRSVASRGKSGGISFATRALAHVFDAFGVDLLLVETVGAGQSETDIANMADTVCVVLTPESGDAIQALKAGILEIAHVYAINKSDRDGADQIKHEIQSMISMGTQETSWEVPIEMVQGQNGKGVDELWQKMLSHQEFLAATPVSIEKLKARRLSDLLDITRTVLEESLRQHVLADETLSGKIADRNTNIYELASSLVAELRL